MPDPKLAEPWHGIPREQIDWHPMVNDAVSMLVRGFLKLDLLGLPAVVTRQIDRVLPATAGKSL